MHFVKRSTALLLALVIVFGCCITAGSMTAFAAEGETESDPTSTETDIDPPDDEPEGFCFLEMGLIPDLEEVLLEMFPDGIIPYDYDFESMDPEILMALTGAVNLLGGSSGSETGGAGSGGSTAGTGSCNMVLAGVTMQVVYYRYDQCYNRHNSHAGVVNTLQTGKAIPWNSTGKDNGATETTVFDSYTISPYTFIVKAYWNSYPYVYHFPTENIGSDGCTFDWLGIMNYWFNYNNPGGQPSTYPRIVRNETNGSYAIEQFLARIILGNSYGAWDKSDIAKSQTAASDNSLYAATLRYLGVSELAIQNYLDAYYGKLSIKDDGATLIPTIIWSWVGGENLGGTNRIYTIGDVASNGSSNSSWLKTAYTSPTACISGYGSCSWMRSSTDTMICKMMLGVAGSHQGMHYNGIWKNDAPYLFGTGLVNRIQTEVDSTTENGSNTFYYLRGYWTPYGTGTGSVSITKTNKAGTANLSGAEFTLYRDADCATPITESDYSTLSSSDTGYVSASVRRTNSSGKASWTGLRSGVYFMKETKAPDGYTVNVDSSGNVEVRSVAVTGATTSLTITNADNAKPVSLQKSINASQTCIDQLSGNPMYSLAGAQYTISVNGVVKETLTTDASGKAASTGKYNIDDVLTIKEVKAPGGFKLDTKTYTYTVKDSTNIISVSDVPVFDPPFIFTKIDSTTTVPQGNGSFSGAVFKWEYYANNNWSGTPTRTWYFATDADGKVLYQDSYLASGYTSSALYVSPGGANQLPLGTLKITEVKNSLGYIVIPEPLYCSITQDSSSNAVFVWKDSSLELLKDLTGNNWGVIEPIDAEHFGEVTVDKVDSVTGQTAQGEATLEGGVFQIFNDSTNPVVINGKIVKPGEVCCEITTDIAGHAATGKILPFGKYHIEESKAPAGYVRNTSWSKTFAVTAANNAFSFTCENTEACSDEVIRGGVKIIKVDEALGAETGSDAHLDGIRFGIFSLNEQPVVVNGESFNKGMKVMELVIHWDGTNWSAETMPDALPYGSYSIWELAVEDGSEIANDYYFINRTPQTIQIKKDGQLVEKTVSDPLRPGEITILKTDSNREPLAGAKFILEWSTDNKTWSPVSSRSKGTPVTAGTCISDGLNNGCLVSGDDGLVSFSGLHPDVYYRVTELEAPEGYMLLTAPAFEGKLPTENFTVSLRVVNTPVFEMPQTGGETMRYISIAAASCALVGLLIIAFRKKKN